MERFARSSADTQRYPELPDCPEINLDQLLGSIQEPSESPFVPGTELEHTRLHFSGKTDHSTAGRVALEPGVVPNQFQPIGIGQASSGLNPHAPQIESRVAPSPPPDASPDRLVSRFNPEEELWILVEPDEHKASRSRDPHGPGSGSLMCVGCLPIPPGTSPPTQQALVPVPLKHTEVSTHIAAHVASVRVRQQFHNPFETKIEAVYVFPLPDNAAVNEFLMTVGDRTIRGIIRDREEAERIYQAAKRRGHTASVLHQQRPNIFQQKVANIEPGHNIDINITYFHTMDSTDGWFEYTFPMVVGPRFNPPATIAKGTGVAASGRGPAGSSGQQTEVQYLKPHERSGHDIAVTCTIDAGVPIHDIRSTNHTIDILEESETRVRLRLSPRDSIPNKDFVLRYKVAGEQTRSALIVQRDTSPGASQDAGFFTLFLSPPAETKSTERTPLELVFVLDCSGSMSGVPIEQSKAAMRTALRRLEPYDTFQIIRFSNNASALGPAPLAATPQNIQHALGYIDRLSGSGGTMMIEGIKAALDFPHDPARLRFVTFLTDGYIGNEAEIIAAMKPRLRDARVFSFGVGSSPNRHLMNQMAREGRGVAAYISLNRDGGAVMDRFFDRIAHAAMTDLTLDTGPLQGVEVFPGRIPDLFVGKPVILSGRFEAGYESLVSGAGSVSVIGRVGTRRVTIDVPVTGLPTPDASALDAVWARMKIADLNTQLTHADRAHRDNIAAAIESIALRHELMSSFTSFVAVDSSRVTDGNTGYTVSVPVPVPDGVLYETTVNAAPSPGGG